MRLDGCPGCKSHHHLVVQYQWTLVTGPAIAIMWTWDCSAAPDQSSNRHLMYGYFCPVCDIKSGDLESVIEMGSVPCIQDDRIPRISPQVGFFCYDLNYEALPGMRVRIMLLFL